MDYNGVTPDLHCCMEEENQALNFFQVIVTIATG